MKKCPECGENLADDAVHCGKCGSKVEESDDESEKKTMFGMGTVSQEDLEQAAEEAKAASSEAEDSGGDDGGDDDDGFRLPSPGETSTAEESAGADRDDAPSSDDSEGSTRLGLKGPATGSDDDDAALAETEAMPSIDKSDSEPTPGPEGASKLEGGRISSPGGGDSTGGVDAPADVDARGDRPGGESPFAGKGGERPSGVDRNTHDSGRPVPEGPGDPESMADTTPDAGTRGPEAETAPTDTRPGSTSTGTSAGGDTAADAGPSPADVGAEAGGADTSPPEIDPETADGGSAGPGADPGGDGAEQPVSGTATTSGSRASQPSVSAPSDSPENSQSAGGAGDKQRTTSPDGQTGPVEQSRNALADDDRFGGGGAQDQQPARGQAGGEAPLQQQAQTGEESGIDKKTIFIVLGVLAASGILCAGAGIFVYMFMT